MYQILQQSGAIFLMERSIELATMPFEAYPEFGSIVFYSLALWLAKAASR